MSIIRNHFVFRNNAISQLNSANSKKLSNSQNARITAENSQTSFYNKYDREFVSIVNDLSNSIKQNYKFTSDNLNEINGISSTISSQILYLKCLITDIVSPETYLQKIKKQIIERIEIIENNKQLLDNKLDFLENNNNSFLEKAKDLFKSMKIKRNSNIKNMMNNTINSNKNKFIKSTKNLLFNENNKSLNHSDNNINFNIDYNLKNNYHSDNNSQNKIAISGSISNLFPNPRNNCTILKKHKSMNNSNFKQDSNINTNNNVNAESIEKNNFFKENIDNHIIFKGSLSSNLRKLLYNSNNGELVNLKKTNHLSYSKNNKGNRVLSNYSLTNSANKNKNKNNDVYYSSVLNTINKNNSSNEKELAYNIMKFFMLASKFNHSNNNDNKLIRDKIAVMKNNLINMSKNILNSENKTISNNVNKGKNINNNCNNENLNNIQEKYLQLNNIYINTKKILAQKQKENENLKNHIKSLNEKLSQKTFVSRNLNNFNTSSMNDTNTNNKLSTGSQKKTDNIQKFNRILTEKNKTINELQKKINLTKKDEIINEDKFKKNLAEKQNIISNQNILINLLNEKLKKQKLFEISSDKINITYNSANLKSKEIENLKAKNLELTNEIGLLNKKISEYKNQITNFENKINNLKSELNNLNVKYTEIKNESKKFKNDANKSYKYKYELAMDEINSKNREISKLNEDYEQMKNSNKNLTLKLEDVESDKKNIEEKCEKQLVRIRNLNSKIVTFKTKLMKYEKVFVSDQKLLNSGSNFDDNNEYCHSFNSNELETENFNQDDCCSSSYNDAENMKLVETNKILQEKINELQLELNNQILKGNNQKNNIKFDNIEYNNRSVDISSIKSISESGYKDKVENIEDLKKIHNDELKEREDIIEQLQKKISDMRKENQKIYTADGYKILCDKVYQNFHWFLLKAKDKKKRKNEVITYENLIWVDADHIKDLKKFNYVNNDEGIIIKDKTKKLEEKEDLISKLEYKISNLEKKLEKNGIESRSINNAENSRSVGSGKQKIYLNISNTNFHFSLLNNKKKTGIINDNKDIIKMKINSLEAKNNMLKESCKKLISKLNLNKLEKEEGKQILKLFEFSDEEINSIINKKKK